MAEDVSESTRDEDECAHSERVAGCEPAQLGWAPGAEGGTDNVHLRYAYGEVGLGHVSSGVSRKSCIHEMKS